MAVTQRGGDFAGVQIVLFVNEITMPNAAQKPHAQSSMVGQSALSLNLSPFWCFKFEIVCVSFAFSLRSPLHNKWQSRFSLFSVSLDPIHFCRVDMSQYDLVASVSNHQSVHLYTFRYRSADYLYGADYEIGA